MKLIWIYYKFNSILTHCRCVFWVGVSTCNSDQVFDRLLVLNRLDGWPAMLRGVYWSLLIDAYLVRLVLRKVTFNLDCVEVLVLMVLLISALVSFLNKSLVMFVVSRISKLRYAWTVHICKLHHLLRERKTTRLHKAGIQRLLAIKCMWSDRSTDQCMMWLFERSYLSFDVFDFYK